MDIKKIEKGSIAIILLLLSLAVIYRIFADESIGTVHIAGIGIISGTMLFLLVIERIKEFTAGSKGITAKLSALNSEVSDIHNFMLKGIDKDSSAVLDQIKNKGIPTPTTEDEKNNLKFHLRLLREKAHILRDESECKSISDAVKRSSNIAGCFFITQLGEEHLKFRKQEANKMLNPDS